MAILMSAAMVVACADGDGEVPDFAASFTVRGALAEIPVPEVPTTAERDGIVVMTTVDIAGAAALAGVERPALDPALGPPDYDDVFLEYTNLFADRTTDGTPTAVVIPTVELVLDGIRLQPEEDYRTELGWSALDIDAIVEVTIFPETRFDVVTLRRDLAPLVARAGDDGVVDVGAGADGERRIEERTNLRILGRPLRVAPDADRGIVAVARDRPSVVAWRRNEGGDGTWADVAEMAAVAARLDARDVYAAKVAFGDFRAPRIDSEEMLAETMQQAGVSDLDELRRRYPITEPFSAVGVGWFGAADDLRVSIAYAFADAAAARRSVEPIAQAFGSGGSPGGLPPLSQLFTVVEVVAAGSTVEVVLDPAPDVASGPLVQHLLAGNHVALLHR